MTELKTLRIERKLTQKQAADTIGVSLRSYVSYENDRAKSNTAKYRFFLQEISKLNVVDEDHGVLTLDEITSVSNTILPDYDIDYCYLFGSYAKGEAADSSDVDLLIATKITGIRYYEIVERLREKLRKRVDVINLSQLVNNRELLNEVLKDGIKIYG